MLTKTVRLRGCSSLASSGCGIVLIFMFVVGSTTCLSCNCADDGLFRRADHGSFQALVSPAGDQILRCIADSHHLALTAYMAAEQALAQHTALRPQCAWMQLLLACEIHTFDCDWWAVPEGFPVHPEPF